VTLLLENGAELKAKDMESRTSLCWAAQNGHKAVVTLLQDKGANTTTVERRDYTRLLIAGISVSPSNYILYIFITLIKRGLG